MGESQKTPSIDEALYALPALLASSQSQYEQIRLLREEVASLRRERLVEEARKPVGCITWAEAQTKRFISVKQAAFLLNMSEKSIRRLIERCLIKVSKGLRHIRIPVEQVEAYGKRTI